MVPRVFVCVCGVGGGWVGSRSGQGLGPSAIAATTASATASAAAATAATTASVASGVAGHWGEVGKYVLALWRFLALGGSGGALGTPGHY